MYLWKPKIITFIQLKLKSDLKYNKNKIFYRYNMENREKVNFLEKFLIQY
jgi:hypothetical protein